MKILVIQQKMIGDVLVSSIICNNLKKAYPNSQVDYLVYESTVPVIANNPNIDNIIPYTKKYRNNNRALLQLAMEIRKERYDIVIDAYSKIESWIVVSLSGAKKKISYKKDWRTFLYTDNVKFAEFPKTNLGLAIERRLSLLEPLNLDIEVDPFPHIYLTEDEKENATKTFRSHNVDESKKTIMISLLGSESVKTYPLEYMAKLIDAIGNAFNVNILLNYFPKQIDEAKLVYDACSEITKSKIYFNLLATDLRSFIAIMDKCDLIFGNDGGAINIAKALNKPSFIIFSPWIEKKIWSTFEDGIHHVSVHLSDFKPEIFKELTDKELKAKTPEFYPLFKPSYFQKKLINFVRKNLGETEIENIVKPVKLQLSALIITFNEEKHIAAVMEDLSFADEIIVVDSFSTDATPEIVNAHPKAKLIQHKFVDYTSQRNFAIQCAKNPWIVFIDADERFTEELRTEVIDTIQRNNTASAYLFYRTFMFNDEKLNYSGWQTDKIFRLFKKGEARYTITRLVHEKLEVRGQIGKLKNKLIHYSYNDYDVYKNKMKMYGKFKAKEKFLKGTKMTPLHKYIHPTYTFLYQYVIRLGFLDGKKGLTICRLNAYSVSERYKELSRLRK